MIGCGKRDRYFSLIDSLLSNDAKSNLVYSVHRGQRFSECGAVHGAGSGPSGGIHGLPAGPDMLRPAGVQFRLSQRGQGCGQAVHRDFRGRASHCLPIGFVREHGAESLYGFV